MAFVVRTIPSLANAMQPLEDAIRQKFLPALLGRQVSDIAIQPSSQICWARHSESVHPMQETVQGIRELTAPLLALILAEAQKMNAKKMQEAQNSIRKSQKNQAEAAFDAQLRNIRDRAPRELKIAIDQACEKGASSWVTARPRYSHSVTQR